MVVTKYSFLLIIISVSELIEKNQLIIVSIFVPNLRFPTKNSKYSMRIQKKRGKFKIIIFPSK